MENKTALQILIQHIQENYHLTEETKYEFKNALEKEKQQIMDAYNQGYREGEIHSIHVNVSKDISEFGNAENYYYNDLIK